MVLVSFRFISIKGKGETSIKKSIFLIRSHSSICNKAFNHWNFFIKGSQVKSISKLGIDGYELSIKEISKEVIIISSKHADIIKCDFWILNGHILYFQVNNEILKVDTDRDFKVKLELASLFIINSVIWCHDTKYEQNIILVSKD